MAALSSKSKYASSCGPPQSLQGLIMNRTTAFLLLVQKDEAGAEGERQT